ncbi:MAG: coenzyme F420-0:L-glutamate ligase [Oscillospiraceae bacterium]|nr:coenzyme F420-0:L-glutamate ligase [Oscillospiraceae bacterium]MCL2249602.1 coenzyme F420-0:L-glutamate ligase [Oscillospiraceae bacterium]
MDFNMKNTGVVARGIVTPIFRQGDDIINMIYESLMSAANDGDFEIAEGDIVGVTEAVVGRVQGNYATLEQISNDVRTKFGGGTLGIVFPILSRNRFSSVLQGIAGGCDKLIIQLSYPQDEVGNKLVELQTCDEKGVDPTHDSFTEKEFRDIFGMETVHKFTGVDYIEYYKEIGGSCEIVFSNDPRHILKYSKNVLCCDIHTRRRTQKLIQNAGADKCLCLDDILCKSVDGSGYSEYGLLGSNKATDDSVKLFPIDTDRFVHDLQAELKKRVGVTVEVMVYGDGCFKDPMGGIWELADPVVSPAFTSGLAGTPNELKIKYIADNDFADLSGQELTDNIRERIKSKKSNLVGNMASEGTTPRRIHDLVGSLCDLVSGSGDRGTPVVLVQNYFKNYASE